MTKIFSRTIKQLLGQYHKILALCNIEGELASTLLEYHKHSIFRSRFCGINAITDKYSGYFCHNTVNLLDLVGYHVMTVYSALCIYHAHTRPVLLNFDG